MKALAVLLRRPWWAAVVLDVALVALAAFVAYLIRMARDDGWQHHIVADQVRSQALTVTPVVILVWVCVNALAGAYRRERFTTGTEEYRAMLHGAAYSFAVIIAYSYLTSTDLSRIFIVLTFVLGVVLLLAGRYALRKLLHLVHRNGALVRRVVIVGGRAEGARIAAVLARENWLGYRVVGQLIGREVTVEQVVEAADTADLLVLTGGSDIGVEERRLVLWRLEKHPVEVAVAISVSDISAERVRHWTAGGMPMLFVDKPRWVGAGGVAKRLSDLLLGGLLLLLLSPLLLVVALRIWLADRGPVFFVQQRVGRGGRPFGCVKFRTMVVDAESMVDALREERGAGARYFKVPDDPRVTRPGRWLRKLSLDELPQLFNVVAGQMSLVGPRPQVPAEVAEYDDAMWRRLLVRPGITGLWQVSGRSDLSLEESARLDLYYIDNWSMLQDLSILVKTVNVVLGAKGAY